MGVDVFGERNPSSGQTLQSHAMTGRAHERVDRL